MQFKSVIAVLATVSIVAAHNGSNETDHKNATNGTTSHSSGASSSVLPAGIAGAFVAGAVALLI